MWRVELSEAAARDIDELLAQSLIDFRVRQTEIYYYAIDRLRPDSGSGKYTMPTGNGFHLTG